MPSSGGCVQGVSKAETQIQIESVWNSALPGACSFTSPANKSSTTSRSRPAFSIVGFLYRSSTTCSLLFFLQPLVRLPCGQKFVSRQAGFGKETPSANTACFDWPMTYSLPRRHMHAERKQACLQSITRNISQKVRLSLFRVLFLEELNPPFSEA